MLDDYSISGYTLIKIIYTAYMYSQKSNSFYIKEGLTMELRVLQYFLAVTREQSISGAAEALHLSQPTLSRQLKDM